MRRRRRMKRMEGTVCARNIGRWRWADRSLAFNWQHPAYTSAFLLCTLLPPSPSIYYYYFYSHVSTLSRTEGPCSLEIHVARSHSYFRSLGLWIINSPSPPQLPYTFAITSTVCIDPLSPLCTPIAPSSSLWRARECNLPYFVRPARCSPNWPCFFVRMAPFCPPAFPLHLR